MNKQKIKAGNPKTPPSTNSIKSTKNSLLKKILMYLILVLIIIIPIELASYLYIKYKRPEIIKLVDYFKSDKPIIEYQLCISQAYLNYIPTPGEVEHNIVQHNEHGYRGVLVPRKRDNADSFRILFLGGSTTYGWGVADPLKTYPEFTGKYLRENLPGKKIEIINAGVPWGTSAEILIHYLLKFRYYNADLVVINEGGNDAQAITKPTYQPDYSNWRKTLSTLPKVGSFTKALFSSNFFSVLAFHLFYSEFAENDMFVHMNEYLYAKWYEGNATTAMENIEELAFYRNINSVVSEIQNDSSKVLLLSFQGNPEFKNVLEETLYYDFNEEILRKIATDKNAFFLPFPKDAIPDNTWVDDCHLNELGEQIKGEYVGRFILNEILKAK
ncbi:MAG: SGNH/GDSL hydrolase family protein [Bacteroidales bacterium]|nr:SGNH/GDSL hydrolase family protein [Bacteroidales bacterium]